MSGRKRNRGMLRRTRAEREKGGRGRRPPDEDPVKKYGVVGGLYGSGLITVYGEAEV